jgi:hypothetical protein
MSFRKYGGMNYNAKNNNITSNYSNANKLNVMDFVGQDNSDIIFQSDIIAKGGIHVVENVDISGNLTVDGTTTLNESTTINDTLVVNGTTTLNESTTINDTLDVNGATTINNTLDVNGNTTLNSNLTVNGETFLNGPTTINDYLDINADMRIDGNLTVYGNTVLNESTVINDNFSVNAQTAINLVSSVQTNILLPNELDGFYFIPNWQDGIWSNFPVNGDEVILARSTEENNSVLTLTTWTSKSSASAGLRITATDIEITATTLFLDGFVNMIGSANIRDLLTVDAIDLTSDQVTTNPNGVVPKSYVDSIATGSKPVLPCDCATVPIKSANLNLNSLPSPFIVDDYVVQDGDRVLVKNQDEIEPPPNIVNYSTNSVNNGIYVYNSTTNSLTRASDYADGFDAIATSTFIQNGTVNSRIIYIQTTTPAIVGINPLQYAVFYTIQLTLGQGLEYVPVNVLQVKNDLDFVTNVGILDKLNVRGISDFDGIVNTNSSLNTREDLFVYKTLRWVDIDGTGTQTNSYKTGNTLVFEGSDPNSIFEITNRNNTGNVATTFISSASNTTIQGSQINLNTIDQLGEINLNTSEGDGQISARGFIRFYDNLSPFNNSTRLYKSANSIVFQGDEPFSDMTIYNTDSEASAFQTFLNSYETTLISSTIGIELISQQTYITGTDPTSTSGTLTVDLAGSNFLVYRDRANDFTSLVNSVNNKVIQIGSSTASNNLIITGFCGIGTIPATTFDVLVPSTNASDTLINGSGFQFKNGSNTGDMCCYFGADDTNKYSYIQSANIGDTIRPLIFNARGGNVGIGLTTPLRRLHVVSNETQAAFTLNTTENNGTLISTNGTITEIKMNNTTSTNYSIQNNNGTFRIITSSTASALTTGTTLLSIDNLGALSISGSLTTSSNITINNPASLIFSSNFYNRKIVLFGGSNDNEFYGFGVNNLTLRYQVNTTSDSHVFFAGTSSTASNELMRISGNGDVSISRNLIFNNFTGNQTRSIRFTANTDEAFLNYVSTTDNLSYFQIGTGDNALSTNNESIYFTQFEFSNNTTYARMTINGAGVFINPVNDPNNFASIASSTYQLNVNARLGVGITPATVFDVLVPNTPASTIENASGFQFRNGPNIGDVCCYFGADNTNKYSYIQSVTRGEAVRALILNFRGGNVGIGLTTPTRRLHVVNTNTQAAFTLDTTENEGTLISASGTTTEI